MPKKLQPGSRSATLKTFSSYNPSHATQHRPLKPVTFPKRAVTFAEIRTSSLVRCARPSPPKRPAPLPQKTPLLWGEAPQPTPAEPGQPLRYDYEYKRNGTANLFVFLDAHRSWRKVKVTERRMAQDFA